MLLIALLVFFGMLVKKVDDSFNGVAINSGLILGLVMVSVWYGNVLGYLTLGWVVSASGEYGRLLRREKLLIPAIFFPVEFVYNILVKKGLK